jgi:hypothetical protein
MATNGLEQRVIQLGQAFPAFSGELQLAFHYIRSDPKSSLTKSRLVLETLVLKVFTTEMGHEPRKPLLGEMLNDNQFTRKIEKRIVSKMNAIRDMGNVGPHPGAAESSDAEKVLDDLSDVMDWYRQRYGEFVLPEVGWNPKVINTIRLPNQTGLDPATRDNSHRGRRGAALVVVLVITVAVGPVVLATVLGLFSTWSDAPLLVRYAVAAVPIGGLVWVINTWRAREVKQLGRARQQDGINELAQRLLGRLHQPELMTARSARGLALGVEQKVGCPLMTDKVIIEAIRTAALELESRLSGQPLVVGLEALNRLLKEFDADALPLLSLASVDRLNAFLPSQLYLMALLFGTLVLVAFGPSLFELRIPTFVYPVCALLLLVQVVLLLSNVRLESFWRRDANAPSPSARTLMGLDFFRVMMTARNRVLSWVMDCLWGPVWEQAKIMTTRPDRFAIMHEFRFEVAQRLWRRLRDLQDEMDEIGPAGDAKSERRAEEFASLCRQLWVVTGEQRFREIEARGQLTSEDLDNRVICYL